MEREQEQKCALYTIKLRFFLVFLESPNVQQNKDDNKREAICFMQGLHSWKIPFSRSSDRGLEISGQFAPNDE